MLGEKYIILVDVYGSEEQSFTIESSKKIESPLEVIRYSEFERVVEENKELKKIWNSRPVSSFHDCTTSGFCWP